jgi:hypothetical protein
MLRYLIFISIFHAHNVLSQSTQNKYIYQGDLNFSIKFLELNPIVKDCYKFSDINKAIKNQKIEIEKNCNEIRYQVLMNDDPVFIIGESHDLKARWESLIKNRNCTYSSNDQVLKSISHPTEFACKDKFNNVTFYSFKYYKEVSAIGLNSIRYGSCSHTNWGEISEKLIEKFNSFPKSKQPQRKNTELILESTDTGEILSAKLITTNNKSVIQCPGNTALLINLKLVDSNSFDPYKKAVENFMTISKKEASSQNAPKF